ncbi:hypothetical protein F5X99DRAFT_428177 [Biscogniauxia marginata]|nr:hypothetical protein F5X99DRAFT_428177 [Biscogniauxia marginata]
MDPSLEEKDAYFKYVVAHQEYDEEDEELDSQEQTHRRKSKSFQPTVSPSSLPITPSINEEKLPDDVARRAASDIGSKPDDGVEITAVIPRNRKSKRKRLSLDTSTASHDTTVPESTPKSVKQPTRQKIRQPSRDIRPQAQQGSGSLTEPSSKRKRASTLKMVPESRQIFKGLSFYYIPPNDVNPARRLKITRAREHGAIWTKDIAAATHIVVDKGLTLSDIKQILDSDPKSSQKYLVNERYPSDCLNRRILHNPDQGIYRVRDVLKEIGDETIAQSTTKNPDDSLKIKEPRNSASKRKKTSARHEAESSQESIDIIPYSPPKGAGSSPNSTSAPPDQAEETNLQGIVHALDTEDDLSKCIRQVREDPDLYDELDSDETSSDIDSPGYEPRKQKRRQATSKGRVSGHKITSWQEGFKCMKGGTKDAVDTSPNAKTIEILQGMIYEHTLFGEIWRVHAYRKAICVLKGQTKEIRTAVQARALPGIDKIADKIEEIVAMGSLRQLETARNHPDRPALQLFMKIYGVGNEQARKWVAQGFRTLEDVKAKAKLNRNQKIGLDYFDDLNTRISRQEVEALGAYVKKTAAVIDPKCELIIGGSYRRGSDSSHDVDLIVTKQGTSTSKELVHFLNQLVDTLSRKGFLTAALAAHSKGGSTWHGCCVLPESEFPGPKENYRPTWRRIDLLLVPETQFGAALLYFTGNDLFNRSMRLLARKKGIRLNQRALSGAGVFEGRDEKRIFEILGVRWIEPHHRWC